jgi:hypothetical protein
MNDNSKEKLILITAAWLGCFANYTEKIYSAYYHGTEASPIQFIVSCLFVSTILMMPSLIAGIFCNIKFTRFVATGTFIYFIYWFLATYKLIPYSNISTKSVFVFLIIALLYVLVRFCGELFWRKTGRIFMVMFISLLISTPTISFFQTVTTIKPTLSVERIFKVPPKAVVVIIFDELSPEMMPIFRPALTNGEHVLHIGTTLKAGKNTINAIPSMLTSMRHDDVVVCGSTRLCGENPFDMSYLKAAHSSIDVVGFYHPYCAIQGLRSCWSPEKSNSNKYSLMNLNYFLSLLSSLPVIHRVFNINVTDDQLNTKNLRNSIAKTALTAPIWTEGGLLYIHQFLPHPAGLKPYHLKDEYNSNVLDAAGFITTLKNQLQNNFGADYALIITTDHPLRTEFWCASDAYNKADCNKDLPAETENIPFMVSAPKQLAVQIPETNVGIFSNP